MHRCPTFRHRLPAALTALGMLLAPLPVLAQEQAPQTTSLIARLFPMPAVRGKIHFTAGLGTVELNGKPIHTAPGLRILNTSKQLVMLETLHGQTHTVNYVIERRVPQSSRDPYWMTTG